MLRRFSSGELLLIPQSAGGVEHVNGDGAGDLKHQRLSHSESHRVWRQLGSLGNDVGSL